jgi:type VI secretion system protein ImpF
MAREPEFTITQSLIDRLVDPSRDRENPMPETKIDSINRSESFRRYRESVKRDLEWLLNTRQIVDPEAETYVELSKSLYFYGLTDITSLGMHSARDRDHLLRILERTIQKFEPRIASLKVSVEPVVDNSRMLRFRIDGMLRVDPAPEPVTFNTMLELTSGEYEVK